MAKLEIIGMPQSTFVRAVRMVCEEKGVPYELTMARPHSPEINAVHPLGRIPGMRHGDLALYESKAIATYIDGTFDGPKVIPENPTKAAHVEQWVSLINTGFDPVMMRQYLLSYLFPKGADGKPDRAVIDAAIPVMEKQFGIIDQAVAKTCHLVGDSFTFADIDLMPILFYMHRPSESAEMLKSHKNLATYYAKHSERPSFKNTVPPPPPTQQSRPN